MKCARCHETFGCDDNGNKLERCQNCGVHKDRIVASPNSMRRRNIGGKRGRNSGKVSQHGKKGGGV